ncbi:uncharacterized protein LACBIDRAFT_310451 [Laccaria bicolor S238N-H82]|uniref:Predicted protein n=1 Tax=Laccaria bicolor (strain S238N-H82 / ATCC MYA-4686) TaxID=486041 RepID=B0DUD4_LACBS|nr:uncharacterized protein LACBIDRAFT_310451 [Laccaria bicolor S238N-H82]EDR01723.1 predicted protein [Laccaria bicolor S238N-H82]|eukprot:XP_001887536.1 predicted protein [Laccaria bicolor S238N-H82]
MRVVSRPLTWSRFCLPPHIRVVTNLHHLVLPESLCQSSWKSVPSANRLLYLRLLSCNL